MYDIVHVLVFCSLLQVFRLFNEQSGELEYCESSHNVVAFV